jgi:hypothetical protein
MTAPHEHALPQQAPAPVRQRNGFGLAALGLALVGLAFGLVPALGFVAIGLGAPAVLLGLFGVARSQRGVAADRVLTIAGTALGVAALVIGFVATVATLRDVGERAHQLQGAAAVPAEARIAAGGTSAAAFGSTQAWGSGVQVEVSEPRDHGASADGAREVSVEVTVHNGSGTPLLLSSVLLDAALDGRPAGQVFDSAQGMSMPTTSVPPGGDAMFTAAFSLPAASGELQVQVTPELGADRAHFTGRV